MLSRRRALAVLAAGMISAAATAQRKVHRIAYLANDPDPRNSSHTYRAFADALRELGWVEGKNVELSVRTSNGRAELFPALAAELLTERPDVIVTAGSAATQAARAATSTVPIVFGSAANPVEQKLVASLARPGGNVTGLALLVQELGPKRLELLQELLPHARRFVRIYQATSIASMQEKIMRDDDAAARKLGVLLHHLPFVDLRGLDEAFGRAVRLRANAVVLPAAPLLVGMREHVAQLALKLRLPTMCADARFADAGALMAYGENFVSRYRRAAFLVDKILRGTKPADIPVEQPLTFELVINLRTAGLLGLRVPDSLLMQADRVIR